MEPADEDRFICYAVHWCGMSLEDAKQLAREHPEWVEGWNLVRREHEAAHVV
jgi:hypothetical protein